LPARRSRRTAGGLLGRERRVEAGGCDAVGAQRVDLVFHQRDERRDHDRGAGAVQRGHLVAQRLAAAGGHEHERAAAADDVLDDLALVRAELVVAEDVAQRASMVVERAGMWSSRQAGPPTVAEGCDVRHGADQPHEPVCGRALVHGSLFPADDRLGADTEKLLECGLRETQRAPERANLVWRKQSACMLGEPNRLPLQALGRFQREVLLPALSAQAVLDAGHGHRLASHLKLNVVS
jgi:hypothetical protein